VAFVDLGHRATQISMVRHGKVEAVRAISRGGHQVTQAIAKALGIAYHDAERVKHEELRLDLTAGQPHRGSGQLGEDEQHRVARAAVSAIEPLLREVKMSIDALGKRGERPRRIVLMGGTSRIIGLDRLVEEYLGVEVAQPVLKGIVWNDLMANERVKEVGLPAAALALEYVADATPHRINLRRGDMGSLSDFSAIRARAGWIAAFLALVLVVFFARKVMRISTLEGHEEQLAVRLDEYAEDVLGKKTDPEIPIADRFAEVFETVTSRPESETEQVYPQMTAFKVFFEVTRIQKAVNDEAQPASDGGDEPLEEDEDGLPIPPKPNPEAAAPAAPPTAADKHMVELNAFSADVKTPTTGAATISGSGFDIVTIEKFAGRLKQFPCFKKVDRQETKKTNNPNRPGWTDFTIKIDIKCDLQGEPEVVRAEGARGAAAPTAAGEE